MKEDFLLMGRKGKLLCPDRRRKAQRHDLSLPGRSSVRPRDRSQRCGRGVEATIRRRLIPRIYRELLNWRLCILTRTWASSLHASKMPDGRDRLEAHLPDYTNLGRAGFTLDRVRLGFGNASQNLFSVLFCFFLVDRARGFAGAGACRSFPQAGECRVSGAIPCQRGSAMEGSHRRNTRARRGGGSDRQSFRCLQWQYGDYYGNARSAHAREGVNANHRSAVETIASVRSRRSDDQSGSCDKTGRGRNQAGFDSE